MKKHLICILVIALMLTLCSCAVSSKADDMQAVPGTTAPAAQSQGLEFQSNGDGTCTLTGFGDFSGKSLTIPAQSPAGDTVTAIAESALALSERNSYEACMSLETLIFDHVDLTLSGYAVCDLSNLKQIIVKDSAITLDAQAFGCNAIETVQVENSTFGQGLHRLVELSPGMGPASHYRYLFREAVVSGVAVRMEVTLEARQELLGMLRSSPRLVLVQDIRITSPQVLS